MSRRKPLNDALAQNFVYGENDYSSDPSSNESNPSQETEQASMTKKSLLNKFLEEPTPKEPTKRFTVDLPESMHRKLSILAAKSGRKKSEIVRLLLSDLLEDVEV